MESLLESMKTLEFIPDYENDRIIIKRKHYE